MVQPPTLQDKVTCLYERIKNDFYLCRNDLSASGHQYNSALLFGVLTELNKGKQLLFGEYGGGKTTSAEYLNAVFNNIPLDLVKRVAIRGNPQLTEEKLIGRPDYAKLHGQEEKVVWQHFVLVGPKIFDEFNRVPESNQAMVLNGVDRGEWNYLNDFISTGPQPFFATCNYSDKGNNGMLPPMLDRFDVAAESKFPGVANALFISQDYKNEKDKILNDPSLTRKALQTLNSGKTYEDAYKELNEVSFAYGEKLRKEGFSVLSEEDKQKIEEEIKQTPLDPTAQTYFAFLISEMNVSPKYGQKRSIDPPNDASEGLYLQTAFIGSGSRREEKSIMRYAQSLAWLQKQKTANLDHICKVAPHTLWHRLKWTDEVLSRFRDHDRDDPLDLYITKLLLQEGTDEFPGVKKRFSESSPNYQKVLDLVKHGKTNEALGFAKEYAASEKGHPIFIDTIKDLE